MEERIMKLYPCKTCPQSDTCNQKTCTAWRSWFLITWKWQTRIEKKGERKSEKSRKEGLT
mgnify:FL=1